MAEETVFEEVGASKHKFSFENLEHFFVENKQKIAIGAGVAALVIGILLFVFLKFLPDRSLKAQREMYVAELNFKKEAYELALNGDATGKGFLAIQKNYGFTKSANLCNYYIGLCYLNLKKYNDAVNYLDKFSTDDPIIGAAKFNALADAYAEQNKVDDAIKNYRKAANFSDNVEYAPYYLMKLGMYCEYSKKYKEAKEAYAEVKDKYPMTEAGRDAERYIARVSVLQ